MNKHDNIIKNLEWRLNHESNIKYSDVSKNVMYGDNKGEIDLYAIKLSKYNPINMLFFEMKSNKNPKSNKKASKQLDRMYNHFNNKYTRIYCFKVFGHKKDKTGNKYDIVRYKPE